LPPRIFGGRGIGRLYVGAYVRLRIFAVLKIAVKAII
jgi:hypothetical protein